MTLVTSGYVASCLVTPHYHLFCNVTLGLFQAAIKGKLQELGAYIGKWIKSEQRFRYQGRQLLGYTVYEFHLFTNIDEELPDYIMVMVANKKTSQQMADDLSLFLGNNTIKFTAWYERNVIF